MTKRADCTVKALATVADIGYELAEQIALDGGRKLGRTGNSLRIIEAAKRHGLKFRKLRFTNKTVAKFCRLHPVGRFYLRKRGHAFAVLDGAVMDWTSPNSIVVSAWELTKA